MTQGNDAMERTSRGQRVFYLLASVVYGHAGEVDVCTADEEEELETEADDKNT